MSNIFLNEAIPVTEQNWSDDVQPIVSVFNWSYNHVNFIRQSIESILEQKTTFPIEIIIHDDASNDGTIEIIKEYEAKYPRLFRNIIQKENQWSQGKSVMEPLFNTPRGKYIALTHGDDYWSDPNKLQKQVDFLEKNEEYVICGGITKELYQDTGFFNQTTIINENKIYSVQDYVYSNYAATCTLLFNSSYLNPIPEWFKNLSFGDWGLVLTILYRSKKKIIVLSDEMGVYRVHSGGVHSRLTNNKKYSNKALLMHIDFIDFISKKLFQDNEFSVEVKSKKIRIYKEVSKLSKEDNYLNYLFYYMKHIWYRWLLRISKINL
jgi:glycosyltransferase involved in cell wall biosynthesis